MEVSHLYNVFCRDIPSQAQLFCCCMRAAGEQTPPKERSIVVQQPPNPLP